MGIWMVTCLMVADLMVADLMVADLTQLGSAAVGSMVVGLTAAVNTMAVEPRLECSSRIDSLCGYSFERQDVLASYFQSPPFDPPLC